MAARYSFVWYLPPVSPAAHLSARFDAVMANDAATGTVILFGGSGSKGPLADAWTWG